MNFYRRTDADFCRSLVIIALKGASVKFFTDALPTQNRRKNFENVLNVYSRFNEIHLPSCFRSKPTTMLKAFLNKPVIDLRRFVSIAGSM